MAIATGTILLIIGLPMLYGLIMGLPFLVGSYKILTNPTIIITAIIVIGLVMIVKAKKQPRLY